MYTEILPVSHISQAADLLRAGQVVAFPTETVYGLGAVAWNAHAIEKVFAAKNRPADNPLIVHLASIDDVERVAVNISADAKKLMAAFPRGPLTYVLHRHPDLPSIVTASRDTVCVRIPDHQVALELIRSVGEPLVAPSANLSGKPSPTTAQHVLDDLNGRIAAVIDGGPTPIGIESTVIDMTQQTPTILRPGVITKQQLEEVLGRSIHEASTIPGTGNEDGTQRTPSAVEAAIAPGTKYRHYAPSAKIILCENLAALEAGIRANHLPHDALYILSNRRPAGEFHSIDWAPLTTASLYAQFRQADTLRKQYILVVLDDEIRSQSGLMNRLVKAAQQW
jgi:L-threonylcarbamoyladenylate synthase